jgi:hypothetical protein
MEHAPGERRTSGRSSFKRGAIRKVALVGSVAAVAALLWIQTASSQTVEALTVVFPDSEPVSFTDGGRPGDSAGDLLAFRGPITDADGVKIGHMIADAVTMNGKDSPVARIAATITLGNGSLQALGELHFTDGEQGTLAVVGGTGAFVGAAGTATTALDPESGAVTIEVSLLA